MNLRPNLEPLQWRSSLCHRWLLYSILLLAAGASWSLDAQDTNVLTQTNDVLQADQLMTADGVQATDALSDDSSVGTNDVAETNQTFVQGPDGRTRRQQRRPPGRPRQSAPVNDATRPSNSSNSLDYSAFQLVADRNIFDPNRARTARPSAAPKTTDSFSLVGTMSYEKGTFAFFDGTRADYKKVLKQDESIAGYKITAISPDSVSLMLNTNIVQLNVGTQMRRRDDGSWEKMAASGSYASAPTNSKSESAPSGAESDTLQKLRLRREKE